MKVKYAANLTNFKLTAESSLNLSGFEISSAPYFNVLDFLGIEFIKTFGVQGMQRMNNPWAVAYKSLVIDVDSEKRGVSFTTEVNVFRQNLLNFINFLWFAKDNCVYSQTIYGITSKENQTLGWGAFNTISIYSRSDGSFNDCDFTEDEIKGVMEIKDKFFSICPKYNTSHDILDYQGSNRIEKALLFVRSAREVHLLAAKLAMYMSALECLFSTDPGELTLKVSSRVAYYLGKDKEHRISIFTTIKNAYDIRSKYLHGGEPKGSRNKREYQETLSLEVDEIVRAALTKIIISDSDTFLPAPESASDKEKDYKQKQFEKYLKELTL